MKTIFRFILPLGVLGIVTCSKNNSSSQNVITDSSNIFMADPTMFYQDGKYYLSGTYEPDTRDGIRIFSSDNMHSFSIASNKIVLKMGLLMEPIYIGLHNSGSIMVKQIYYILQMSISHMLLHLL